MVSVLAFISGVIRGGSSLTEPTRSWAATKTGNTSGIAASNRFMGYSVFGSKHLAGVFLHSGPPPTLPSPARGEGSHPPSPLAGEGWGGGSMCEVTASGCLALQYGIG